MPKILVPPLLALMAWLAAAGPAASAASDWISNEGGRARLVLLAPDAEGIRRGMVEIEPAPGWITYWREPGDSGIPPQLTVTPPATLVSLRFPAPKILKLGSLTDLGYDGRVAFPVTLGAAPGPVEAMLFIGLCKEICIPFQANMTVADAGPAAPEEEAAVTAAEALLPPERMEGLVLKEAALSPAGDSLQLVAELGQPGAKADVIVTGPPGYAFTAEGTADGKGQLSLAVPLTGLSAKSGLPNGGWRAVIRSGARAIETDFSLK